MPSSWEKVKVADSNMRLYVSAPENQWPAGAVVVVQGQTGVNDMIQFSDLAAQNDFIAAAPDLYHRDPPDCKDDWPTRRMRLTGSMVIADINATVDFLKSHNSVDAGRIGIVGFCMGGRRSSGPKTFTVRSWGTSAKTIRTHHLRI